MEIKITFIFKITKNYFMDGFAFSSWIYLHAGRYFRKPATCITRTRDKLAWHTVIILQAVPMNYWVIGSTLLITVILIIIDYIIPAAGTKRFEALNTIWGTNIGLVIGLLAPIPFGF
jgi:hypothetical protein